jgi:hypothetical protein
MIEKYWKRLKHERVFPLLCGWQQAFYYVLTSFPPVFQKRASSESGWN